MTNRENIIIKHQKRALRLGAVLLWIIGVVVLLYFDGLSLISFLGLSFALIGSDLYSKEIKWWAKIGVIVVGIFWVGLSYLEHVDPVGAVEVREWWILGVIAILVGVYWLLQSALAKFYHDLQSA